MRGVGAVLALVGALSMTGGCGPAASPASAPPPSHRPQPMHVSTSIPSPTLICEYPSASAIAAIDATVRAKGEGNRLEKAGVVADPDSGLWLVAGPFAGPAGQGEGALGIWATSTDPTLETFTGKVYAVDDAATQWSTAPRTRDVTYDPTDLPVLRCLPS